MCSGSCVGGFSEPTRGLKSIVYNKTRCCTKPQRYTSLLNCLTTDRKHINFLHLARVGKLTKKQDTSPYRRSRLFPIYVEKPVRQRFCVNGNREQKILVVGIGEDSQMASTFSIRIFRFQGFPFTSKISRYFAAKLSHHLHSDRNLRNFGGIKW